MQGVWVMLQVMILVAWCANGLNGKGEYCPTVWGDDGDRMTWWSECQWLGKDSRRSKGL